MIRRLLLAAGAAVLGVGLIAPLAGAEQIEEGRPWGGTNVTPPGMVTGDGPADISIRGVLRSNGTPVPTADVVVTPIAPAGCPAAPAARAATVGGGAITAERPYSTAPFTFPAELCNGAYQFSIQIARGTAVLTTTAYLSRPAPTVTDVKVLAFGRTVQVTWDDMRDRAADLSGYVVERKVGDGEYEAIATVSADRTELKDDDLPSGDGTASYRVRATRPAADGSTMQSTASDAAATPFSGGSAGAPGDGDSDGDGTGDPGAGSGDGTGTPGSGDGTTGTSAPGGSGSGRGAVSSRVRPPQVGSASSTFFPPLATPSPPTTIDDGFSETLPFDDAEPGAQDPVLPDEELASMIYEDEAGRGLAIPIATALVLAVWAFHLRYLARAAS